MVAAMAMVGAKMGKYALAIGMDTAQGRPGDELEYTAAAGGAAFVIGPADEALAVIEGSYSFVTDTPDFWRRADQRYPSHGQRFTGEPAYFKHITEAGSTLMEGLGSKPEDYRYCVFHQPNTKFPQRAAKLLGFTPEQNKAGLLSPVIGNTYAGAAMIGLTAILDEAQPGDRILMVSFGSGAGSDAFSLKVTDKLLERRDNADEDPGIYCPAHRSGLRSLRPLSRKITFSKMIELIALTGLLVAGIAVAAVFGLVFLVLKVVLWAVILPFRILFKLLMIPVWLTLGALGLAAGAAALPILLVVGAGVVVVGVLAALVALLIPAIPFVLLGLAIWAVMRRRPAVA